MSNHHDDPKRTELDDWLTATVNSERQMLIEHVDVDRIIDNAKQVVKDRVLKHRQASLNDPWT